MYIYRLISCKNTMASRRLESQMTRCVLVIISPDTCREK